MVDQAQREGVGGMHPSYIPEYPGSKFLIELAHSNSAALILALGLGANTAMFNIVYGVLLRPLPYPNAAAIVRIGESLGSIGVSDMWVSNRSMPLLEESAESFEQLAGYQEIFARSASLDGATLSGARVSPSLFPLLASRPQLGRLFMEEEARDGADGVVLLSHGVWTSRFGSDADVVGTLVDLDGEPYTVVGVLPEGFDFPNPDNEFWTPLVIPPFGPPSMDGSAEPRTVVSLVFGALGRLRPGVSPEQAATEARTILQTSDASLMARAGENQASGEGPEVDVRVVPLLEEMVGEYRPALLVLTAATALVLLIACINVAGLLLARGVTRQRMFAVCAALGAGRGRLVRQLLTESVALSLRVSVGRRSPGSNGWPGTPWPAGSSGLPRCVADLATGGRPASSPKSCKPTRSARSPGGRPGRRGCSRRLRSGRVFGRRPSSGDAATGTPWRSFVTSRRA